MPPLKRLKEIRQSRFLTQKDLADKSGVSIATIVRIENQRSEAEYSTAKKLAAALEVEPSELVGETPQ